METEWDLVDPNPDLHALFIEFGRIHFGGNLGSVLVEWSKRMTSCAGICYFTPNTRHCVIRISEPLLKFRPRQDLVDTLLHEMIHAFLFVTNNNTDRDDHGPQFQGHMRRINAAAGASITVYHNFGDEVDFYKVHVWQCNGLCRWNAPYFGIVRRSMNRAPGPNDNWWAQHCATCGGEFTKIAGPKTSVNVKSRRKSSKVKNDSSMDVVPVVAAGINEHLLKNNVTGDIRRFFAVLNQPTRQPEAANVGKDNGARVFTFSDLNDSENMKPLTAGGSTMGASSSTLWPGIGIRLGLGPNTAGGPSSTITSGSLLAMERKNCGPDEASCAKQDIFRDAASTTDVRSVDKNDRNNFVNKGRGFAGFPNELEAMNDKATSGMGDDIFGHLNDFGTSAFQTDPASDFDLDNNLDKSTTSELDRIKREVDMSLKSEMKIHFPEKGKSRLEEKNSKGNLQPPIGTMATAHKITVECPLCSTPVPLNTINEHIDNRCNLTNAGAASSGSAMTRCQICQTEIRRTDLKDHEKVCFDSVFDEMPVGLPLSTAWSNQGSLDSIWGSGAITGPSTSDATADGWERTGSKDDIWGGGAIVGPSDGAAIASLSDDAAVAGPSDGAAVLGPSVRTAIVRPLIRSAIVQPSVRAFNTSQSGASMISGPLDMRALSDGAIAGPSRNRFEIGLLENEAVPGPSGMSGRGASSLFANNRPNTVACPVCNVLVPESIINDHLDGCIQFD